MNYSVFAAIFLVFCTTSTHIFVLKLGQIRSSPSPAFSESSVSWKTQAISQKKTPSTSNRRLRVSNHNQALKERLQKCGCLSTCLDLARGEALVLCQARHDRRGPRPLRVVVEKVRVDILEHGPLRRLRALGDIDCVLWNRKKAYRGRSPVSNPSGNNPSLIKQSPSCRLVYSSNQM